MRQHPTGLVTREGTDGRVLGVRVDDPGAGVVAEVHPGTVVVGETRDDHTTSELEPCRVARRHPGQRLLGRPCRSEGLPPPRPELVAVGVVEPPQLLAVGAEHTRRGAVRAAGGLHPLTRRDVERVQLVHPGLVADQHGAVGRVPGRVRQPDADGVEAGPPPGLGRRVVEEPVGDRGERVGRRVGHPASLNGGGARTSDDGRPAPRERRSRRTGSSRSTDGARSGCRPRRVDRLGSGRTAMTYGADPGPVPWHTDRPEGSAEPNAAPPVPGPFPAPSSPPAQHRPSQHPSAQHPPAQHPSALDPSPAWAGVSSWTQSSADQCCGEG